MAEKPTPDEAIGKLHDLLRSDLRRIDSRIDWLTAMIALCDLADTFLVADENGTYHSDKMIRAAGMALRKSATFRDIRREAVYEGSDDEL